MKKLGFGCMRLPVLDESDRTSFDKNQICKMVDTFLERGFRYFDTAYFYHDGKSENVMKEALVDRYDRSAFILADKLPTPILKEKDDLDRIFGEQLEKTGAGYFDYYLMHCLNADLYAKLESLGGFEFALGKKREGKIKKLGFSFHDSADVLDKILTEHPEVEFVQLQINYLDWENEKIQSRRCHEVAIKHGKDIIIMEPVKGGTLAKVPEEAEKLFKASEPDMSAPSWAIRFAASLDNVIMVLSGMSTIDQLLDNTSYMQDFKPLTDDEKNLCYEVADIINAASTVPCTACRYCVEGCPAGIAIPEYFAVYNKGLTEGKGRFSYVKDDYLAVAAESGAIADCVGCKHCEEHCPQHIEIVDVLKKIGKIFG